MEPKFLQKNTRSAEHSFYCRHAQVPHTYDELHYHKEFELLFTLKNRGTRFIGDDISEFGDDDLVLVGPGLPHCWQSDQMYYRNDPEISAEVILIHFERDFLGKEFSNLPEMKALRTMFEQAQRGLYFPAPGNELKRSLLSLTSTNGWQQVTTLLTILGRMSDLQFYPIASQAFSDSFTGNNCEDKIISVYNYIIKNYQRNIPLKELADYAFMNPAAFCRFLKTNTSKTFTEILNEIKIGIACKNLINTNLSIAEIAYDCGYQSVSYFNRQFKGIKGVTPTSYRDRFPQ